MALRDQPMHCGACGYRFVYTVREQRQRAELGLWESGTLLFCPRCKSADVQPVETGQTAADEPAVDRPPRVQVTERPRSADRGGAPGGQRSGSTRTDGPASASDASGGHGSRRPGQGDDRHGGRRGPGGERGARRDGGPQRAGQGRPGGRRPDRQPPRQTELRVRYVGIVKWFDPTRGYGFIADDDGGELFLHASGILVGDPTVMREGTPVEFEIERTGRGPQAVDVVPLA